MGGCGEKQTSHAVGARSGASRRSGRGHLLVSYAVDGGFTIGRIDHGAFQPLPITQPFLPNNATLVIAW